MPELPEVEVVRAGLERHLIGKEISEVSVYHPRAIRKHLAGPKDFEGRLVGRKISDIRRRGKYLWFEFDDDEVLVGHLGMSGQFLLVPTDLEFEKHLRINFAFANWPTQLRFVDQRTFGGMSIDQFDSANDAPASISNIALDPFDPAFDIEELIERLRGRDSQIKRLLLDQNLVSGIGNIYADESLWRAKIHPERPASSLTKAKLKLLIESATAVMGEALAVGGTSFDDLYVNVNGESGYFERGLAVYGRRGEPCPRCRVAIRREAFMNRSSHFCPGCQPGPRTG